MEGLGNPYVLQPEGFRPLRDRQDQDIERAWEEYRRAQETEDLLCTPDAYDLLFSTGELDIPDDGR